MAIGNNIGPEGAGQQIRLLVERAQNIRKDIKELNDDLKDVFAEAKSRGFDPKPLKKLVSWLEKDPDKRREEDAILELYKTALGVGDGSLSDSAREFVRARRAAEAGDDDGQLDAFTAPREAGAKDVSADFGDDLSDKPLTEEDARKLGAQAQAAGRPVTVNPFKPGDDRRIAWDEAWCGAAGSDGMDIPPELRPTPKPKKDDDDKKGGNA